MQINIYKDKMLGARLFGGPVLFSAHPIPRKDIPRSEEHTSELPVTA